MTSYPEVIAGQKSGWRKCNVTSTVRDPISSNPVSSPLRSLVRLPDLNEAALRQTLRVT
jgi:hypothetical protein